MRQKLPQLPPKVGAVRPKSACQWRRKDHRLPSESLPGDFLPEFVEGFAPPFWAPTWDLTPNPQHPRPGGPADLSPARRGGLGRLVLRIASPGRDDTLPRGRGPERLKTNSILRALRVLRGEIGPLASGY